MDEGEGDCSTSYEDRFAKADRSDREQRDCSTEYVDRFVVPLLAMTRGGGDCSTEYVDRSVAARIAVIESGEVIRNAVVFCENAHLGTFIHDTLHMLGGVVDDQRMTPCLYDHDLQAKVNAPEDWAKILINMGYWDPLSSHFPYDRELPPAGLSSWTKLRLGWIDPAKIALVNPGETKTIRLDPLESNDPETLVIKIPLDATRYYLIENRQAIEADANLPSSGVLILYADDSVNECRHGKTPVKVMDANPEVAYLNDAAYEIGKNQVFIDLENGLAVVLLKKDGLVYEVMVTTPDQVKLE